MTLTPSQRFLANWLHRGPGQLGECKGSTLNFLFGNLLACFTDHSIGDQPQGGDYRWVVLTDAGLEVIEGVER